MCMFGIAYSEVLSSAWIVVDARHSKNRERLQLDLKLSYEWIECQHGNPFTNVGGDPNRAAEDNYNFFHLQLRIWVECAFGMLVQR
ncbi:hypothetical protein ACHAW5_005368 [Stephanodiscus triporus]|uniref:DDE Tnp4 domain-containing protein n=1 Tax=Stephanodiscus triporus TaxID=2934178 RepID=A0ABD3PE53_9STRA